MLLTLLVATLASAPLPSTPVDTLRPDQEIRQVALRHADEIQRCYETHGLKVNPSLSGTLEVEVTVLPTGRVDSASVSASQLRGPGKDEVEACVVMVVRNWRFERGPFRTEAIVYPFQLVKDRGRVRAT